MSFLGLSLLFTRQTVLHVMYVISDFETNGKGDEKSDQLGERLQEAMPRLPAVVRRHVEEMGGLLERGHVGPVQSALAALVDETEVRPGETEEGRPCHLIRVKGALDRAFGLLSGRRQALLVAGAGFEPATSGL